MSGTPLLIVVSDRGTTWPIHLYRELTPEHEEDLRQVAKSANFECDRELYLCRVERVLPKEWIR